MLLSLLSNVFSLLLINSSIFQVITMKGAGVAALAWKEESLGIYVVNVNAWHLSLIVTLLKIK